MCKTTTCKYSVFSKQVYEQINDQMNKLMDKLMDVQLLQMDGWWDDCKRAANDEHIDRASSGLICNLSFE